MEVGYWVGVGGASIPGEERLTEKERNGVTERSGLSVRRMAKERVGKAREREREEIGISMESEKRGRRGGGGRNCAE